jgi:hypothetical protein
MVGHPPPMVLHLPNHKGEMEHSRPKKKLPHGLDMVETPLRTTSRSEPHRRRDVKLEWSHHPMSAD